MDLMGPIADGYSYALTTAPMLRILGVMNGVHRYGSKIETVKPTLSIFFRIRFPLTHNTYHTDGTLSTPATANLNPTNHQYIDSNPSLNCCDGREDILVLCSVDGASAGSGLL
ncbi:hypothetical protein OIU85_006760 [Salix viminalis]|uniref:Uncharacterized protein n=1 Tax=Salix viminalis TaxID=40686 RepID=A0A9Q0PLK5_SALVM|nr:hypothetical protein OIU85_006760 [Salix viminalis]